MNIDHEYLLQSKNILKYRQKTPTNKTHLFVLLGH